MAQLFHKYESTVAPFFKNGVTLDFYTITFTGADLTAKLGADSAGFLAGTYTAEQAKSPVVKAFEAIQAKTSIELVGTPRYSASDTTIVIAVAALGGAYGTDDYASYGAVGTGSTFANYLTSLVQNGGTYQGFAMSGCAVAAGVRGVAF
jgi:hypothetical protein